MPDWLLGDAGDLLAVVPTTVGIYVTVLVATRLVGLRSLAKLSSFDFAATVAVGTLLATSPTHAEPRQMLRARLRRSSAPPSASRTAA